MVGAVQLFTANSAIAQCPPSDFVTGGGWILPDMNVKANFGVGGGCKNGAFWGHLEYVDHGSTNASGLPTPFRVHGTSVTGYNLGPDPNTRDITGTAETNDPNSRMVTYCVEVTDNGEGQSGMGDSFGLQLSNGYLAFGTLGGGNIQLHKGNPPPTSASCGTFILPS